MSRKQELPSRRSFYKQTVRRLDSNMFYWHHRYQCGLLLCVISWYVRVRPYLSTVQIMTLRTLCGIRLRLFIALLICSVILTVHKRLSLSRKRAVWAQSRISKDFNIFQCLLHFPYALCLNYEHVLNDHENWWSKSSRLCQYVAEVVSAYSSGIRHDIIYVCLPQIFKKKCYMIVAILCIPRFSYLLNVKVSKFV